MRNSFLLAPIVGLLVVPFADATTIGFSPSPTARTVVDSTSAALNDISSLVWVGNFSNIAFSLNNTLSLQDNVTAIAAAGGWEQFGLDTSSGSPNLGVTGAATISASGKLGGSISDITTGATKADYFNNKDLYVWIFNAPSVASASQMGIFRATTATTPWVFPTNAGGGLGDTTTLGTTVGAASVISAIGGVGSTSSSVLQLTAVTPIPEPSTFAFGIIGALAALSSRSRSRRLK